MAATDQKFRLLPGTWRMGSNCMYYAFFEDCSAKEKSNTTKRNAGLANPACRDSVHLFHHRNLGVVYLFLGVPDDPRGT